MRPGHKQELDGSLTESSAPCQSPLASSCAAPGAQPCILPEPSASGAPVQGDGTQQSNTTRSAPGEGPGHICCPGSWHQGWVSLLVPQDGVSQQAHGVGWEILWTKAASADTGKCVVHVGCSQDARSSRADGVWGRLALLPPRTPLVPGSARLLAADRVAVALWQDRSLALTRVNRGPEWGCRNHGRTGCAPPGNLGRSRLSWLPRAHTGQQMACSTPRLPPFQNNHPKKGKWQ